jgi:hypothetical protein
MRFSIRKRKFLGRTHRSNQVSAPEYVFVISELAGEKRFASTYELINIFIFNL